MWQKICLTVLVIFAAANASSMGSPPPEPGQPGQRKIGNRMALVIGNRMALVIGNGEYKAWPTLRNPPNDAASVSNALRKLGFTVFVHTDLANSEMRRVIAEFGRKAYQAEVAVFFFAGHGIQNKSQNFLMPTDVKAYSLADAVDQGINLNLALEELDNAQSEIKIVMLDACRENPYSNEYRGTKSGLAPVDVTNNMIIVYSTQPGNIAADRVGGGKNSPFTSSLVEALQSRDLSLGNVLKVTSKLVKQKTDKQQVPYVNGPRDLDDFLLAGVSVAVENDAPPVLPVEVRQAFEPEMVNIPAGSFEMGSPSNEEGRSDAEGPVHTVQVKAFQMGKYEITQGEWQAVMGNNPSYFSSCGERCPVENVSWNDVQDYITKLNAKTGKNYRLPTEAEWEYAARAGTSTRFSFGNDDSNLGNYAWFRGNSNSKTHPVGKKQPNPWGLYDMHGNVCEWNQDQWHSSYSGVPTDGSAWEAGDSNDRLLRGCSRNASTDSCRSASRNVNGLSCGSFGVRVVAAASSP